MRWKTVEFTEFVRSNARRRPLIVDLGLEAADKAANIVEAGLMLTVENLGNGQVAWAIAGANMDVALVIVPNGTNNPKQIIDMIMNLDIDKAKERDASSARS